MTTSSTPSARPTTTRLAGIFRSTEPFQNEVRNATMWWEFPVPQGEGRAADHSDGSAKSRPRAICGPPARQSLHAGRRSCRAACPGVSKSHSASRRRRNALDPNQLGSGRLELARWIASPANPLTARVMVNRIWQHHFGRGIVATSDNFGARGERPSHPELLDWLASRFVESGLEHQVDAPADGAVQHLPAKRRCGCRRPASRSRPTLAAIVLRDAAFRPRSYGMRCWPPAASSTESRLRRKRRILDQQSRGHQSEDPAQPSRRR